MRFNISTTVGQLPAQVFEGFTEDLFLKLAPPFPPVKLLRFDGCKIGDVVQVRLNFIFFKQIWESHIIDAGIAEDEIFFIDKGIKLPFFLGYWQHKHFIRRNTDNTSSIIDAIEFKSPWGKVLDFLLFPTIYVQFYYRKPIYKRVFSKKKL